MVKSLRGSQEHNIDEKGRIVVPVKFREILGDHFVITLGMNKTIILCPLEYFNYIEEESLNMVMNSKFRTFFIGNACDVEVDKQGRIVIPAKLRKFARLEKECTYVGATEFVQLWNTQRYDDYLESIDNDDELQQDLLNMNRRKRAAEKDKEPADGI